MFRSNRSHMFFKIGVLKNFAIFTEKKTVWKSDFNKFAVAETLAQMFCEISKNSAG